MSSALKVLDIEGLKVLWKEISLQDYPNNDMLIGVINAIDATKADKIELSKNYYNKTDIDSQSKNYATAEQGRKADSAIQSINLLGETLTNGDSLTIEEVKALLKLKAIISTIDSIADIKYTPKGSIELSTSQEKGTINSVGAYTPEGAVTGSVIAEGTSALVKNDAGVALSGTVSAPNITIVPTTETIQSISSVGTLPVYQAASYTAPSMTESKTQFAKSGVDTSINGNTLIFTSAEKADAVSNINFDAGSYQEATFNPGSLPVLGKDVVVMTEASAIASTPQFTGDKFEVVFNGTSTPISAKFEGTSEVIEVSGEYDKIGINSATFTGEETILTHTLNKTDKEIIIK